ncbi:MAG: amidohydrolase/deacetylase family metallohydrolase [Balneolaceae bacterium]
MKKDLSSTLRMGRYLLLICCISVFSARSAPAQSFDLLLKGGHVIDPANGIDARMDVAIDDGKIALVTEDIPASEAEQLVDAAGFYITPGLIDLHSHHYYGTQPHSDYSNGFWALPPDGFTFRAGVTTAVDGGGAGWRDFRHFKEQVIDRSDTRILAFLNLLGRGMKNRDVLSQNMNDMDPKMTALVARQYDEIVGIKIAHYRGDTWEPFHRAVQAGEEAGIPVMVDFSGAESPLSLEGLLLDVLRPGDIYTHIYSMVDGSVIDESGTLREGMLQAQQQGTILDVGHGAGSFHYPVAVPATEQGLWPNTISTDLHASSMNGGAKDMANTMSKMLNLGMSLQEVIEASTWTPAQVIQREELGHLSEGAVADVAVFNLLEGDFGYLDVRENLMPGRHKLQAELTIRAGEVVWDLNGMAGNLWREDLSVVD